MNHYVRTACAALACVAVLGTTAYLLFCTAKRSALEHMEPLADIVTYDSAKLLVRGTSKQSPSFLFLFKPDQAMDDHAMFYVEAGLAGRIKRFIGPLVQNDTTNPAAVRASIQRGTGTASRHSAFEFQESSASKNESEVGTE